MSDVKKDRQTLGSTLPKRNRARRFADLHLCVCENLPGSESQTACRPECTDGAVQGMPERQGIR
jgi:hypothetical protein